MLHLKGTINSLFEAHGGNYTLRHFQFCHNLLNASTTTDRHIFFYFLNTFFVRCGLHIDYFLLHNGLFKG